MRRNLTGVRPALGLAVAGLAAVTLAGCGGVGGAIPTGKLSSMASAASPRSSATGSGSASPVSG